jgi:hypothetical protein
MNLNEMSFDELVPSQSKFLSKTDVGEDGLILTVKGFRMETVKGDDGDEDKMVLHFVEDMKPMILNRTNAQLIGVVTGAKVAGDAKGKQIVVYNDPTIAFGGRVTGGLRIKKVSGAPKPAAASVRHEDDDIGF